MSVQQIDSTEQELRERYRKTDDAALLCQSSAAKYMCSPEANMGKPPRECFVAALRITREVWRERHPKLPL